MLGAAFSQAAAELHLPKPTRTSTLLFVHLHLAGDEILDGFRNVSGRCVQWQNQPACAYRQKHAFTHFYSSYNPLGADSPDFGLHDIDRFFTFEKSDQRRSTPPE